MSENSLSSFKLYYEDLEDYSEIRKMIQNLRARKRRVGLAKVLKVKK